MDKVYTKMCDVYKAAVHPHIISLDKTTVLMWPSYTSLLKCTRPARRTIRLWLSGVVSALQDCFEYTDLHMFKDAATHDGCVNLDEYTESVSSFIGKHTEDVTIFKHITTRSKKSPVFSSRY